MSKMTYGVVKPSRLSSGRQNLSHLVIYPLICVSLVGFLGYYARDGFVTFSPALVLSLQMLLLTAAIVVNFRHVNSRLMGIGLLVLLAVWSAATVMWAIEPSIAARRWLMIFVPGVLLAFVAAGDPRPHRSYMFLVYTLIVIVLTSGVYTFIVYYKADFSCQRSPTPMIRALGYVICDGWGIGLRAITIGESLVGMAEGGRQLDKLGLYIPRFSGLTSNPNSLGLFAGLGLVGWVAVLQPKLDGKGVVALIAVVFLVLILLSSLSRSAFVMTFTGICTAILLRSGCYGWVRVIAILALGSPLLLYGFSYLFGGLLLPGGEYPIVVGLRSDVWGIAIRALGQIWHTGIGFSLIQEGLLELAGFKSSGHSIVLSIFVETGIVGLSLCLAAWFWPVFSITRNASTLSGASVGVVSLLVALFVHQLFDSSVLRYHWAHFIFVYLLGLSACLRKTDCSTETVNGC